MSALKRIGVMTSMGTLHNWNVDVFAGIHSYFEQSGTWELIIDEWADFTLPKSTDEKLPFVGIVGHLNARASRRAKALGIPAVNVHFSSPVRNLPGVFPDYAAAGRMLAEHLVSRGHSNFGVLANNQHRASLVISKTFTDTLDSANCTELVLETATWKFSRDTAPDVSARRTWIQVMRQLDQWMDTWRVPIGLYLYDPTLARVLIDKAAVRGWAVPDDVAIVVAHNEKAICERPTPGLTAANMPFERVGFEAAKLLDRLIDQKNKKQRRKSKSPERVNDSMPETVLIPPRGIVTRRSTDFFAVEDDLVRSAMQLIDQGLHRPLNVETVARELHVSKRLLELRFRQKLDRTVAGEIQRLRLARVQRELRETDASIQQIAIDSGFNGVSTLYSVFAKEVGCTPSEYRQEHLSDGKH